MKCLRHLVLTLFIQTSLKLSNRLLSLISQTSFKLSRHIRKIPLHHIIEICNYLRVQSSWSHLLNLHKPFATNPTHTSCDKTKLFASQITTCHLAQTIKNQIKSPGPQICNPQTLYNHASTRSIFHLCIHRSICKPSTIAS